MFTVIKSLSSKWYSRGCTVKCFLLLCCKKVYFKVYLWSASDNLWKIVWHRKRSGFGKPSHNASIRPQIQNQALQSKKNNQSFQPVKNMCCCGHQSYQLTISPAAAVQPVDTKCSFNKRIIVKYQQMLLPSWQLKTSTDQTMILSLLYQLLKEKVHLKNENFRSSLNISQKNSVAAFR